MQRFQATSAQETWALIFSTLSMILHNAPNRYLQSYLNIQEQIDSGNLLPDVEIGLQADRRPDGEHCQRYNLPTSNNIAILMPNEGSADQKRRMVICSF